MATVRSIAAASLRRIGVLAEGESPTAAQAADALESLNALLDQWAADRLQIYTTTRFVLPLIDGLQDYLLGLDPDRVLNYSDGFDTLWVTNPVDWTAVPTGTGAITNETVVFQAGGHSVFLDSGATGAGNSETMYQDFTVNAGAPCTLSVYLQGLAASTFVTLAVQNRTTLSYLQSDGSWAASSAVLAQSTNTVAFVQTSLAFDVEALNVVGIGTCDIRVIFSAVGSAGRARGYVDTFRFSTAGNVGIERPVYLDQVNIVDTSSSTLERPLQGPMTDGAWANLRQKDLASTQPSGCYYNPTFPYGTLSFSPVPDSSTLEAVLYVPAQVRRFAATTDTFYLPPGYERMIVTNLALEMAPEYGTKPSDLLIRQAMDSMQAVQRANFRMADLGFEAATLFGQGGAWDIRTGP